MNAQDALAKLKAGNQHYVQTSDQGQALSISVTRPDSAEGQHPFAVIIGCSDSRVPAELVFNQSLGDLFVIRVAGNIIAPSQIGSVEFACEQFGTSLVVVLGHTHCGAIKATVSALQQQADISPNVASIVDRITPAVHPVVAANPGCSMEQLTDKAMRANVQQSVEGLQRRSPILQNLVADEKLLIVGAAYDLDSGAVTFY